MWDAEVQSANREIRILLTNPLFMISLAAYCLNTFVAKNYLVDSHFLKFYFNDLLLVPCALPPILSLISIAGFRDSDKPPSCVEVLICLCIWSIAFEIVGPLISQKTTADPFDIAAYWLGGAVSWSLWNYHYKIRGHNAYLSPRRRER